MSDTMDTMDPAWHTRIGNEVMSVIYDPLTPLNFYVYPAPGVQNFVAPAGIVPGSLGEEAAYEAAYMANGPVWIEIAYAAKPTKIPSGGAPASEIYRFDDTNNERITVDDDYVEDLVNYVVARANMSENRHAEPAKAQAFTQMFTASLNAKVAAVTGANPNITMLPGVSGAEHAGVPSGGA